MNQHEKEDKDLEEIELLFEKDGEIANRVLLDMVKNQRENAKHLRDSFIATVVSFAAIIIAMIICFFVWDSQFVYTTEDKTVEENVTQEVSGENSTINNVDGDQYNDNATHNE